MSQIKKKKDTQGSISLGSLTVSTTVFDKLLALSEHSTSLQGCLYSSKSPGMINRIYHLNRSDPDSAVV